MFEGNGHTLRVRSTQLLQRWKDMSDAHFVPRPLPRRRSLETITEDKPTVAYPALAPDLAAVSLEQQQQQQQQQEEQQEQPVLRSPWAVSTATHGTRVPASQEVAMQNANVPLPQQLFSHAHLAARRRRSCRAASPFEEQCSDIDSIDECGDDAEAKQSGVCKYFVNSGRCPRGALCPHVHDASLRHRWLLDR